MVDDEEPDADREQRQNEGATGSGEEVESEGGNEPVAVDFSVDDSEEPQTFEHSADADTGTYDEVQRQAEPEAVEGDATRADVEAERGETTPLEEATVEENPADTDVDFEAANSAASPESFEAEPADTNVDFDEESETDVDVHEQVPPAERESPDETDTAVEAGDARPPADAEATGDEPPIEEEPAGDADSTSMEAPVEEEVASEPDETAPEVEEAEAVDASDAETTEDVEAESDRPPSEGEEDETLVLQPELDALLDPPSPESVEFEPLPDPDERGEPVTLAVYRDGERLASHTLASNTVVVGGYDGEEDDEEATGPVDLDLSDVADGLDLWQRHLTIYRHERSYSVRVTSDGETQWNDELLELGSERPLEDGDLLVLGGGLGLKVERP